MAVDRDIVVIGGGPSGLACAALLADCGFSVRLIERAAPPAEPCGEELRFYALSPRSIGLLERLGVWSKLAASACPYRAMQVWDKDPNKSLSFSAGDVGKSELGWIVGHGDLVSALLDRVPTSVASFGKTPHGFSVDADGTVTVKFQNDADLSCRLLVAADGARSWVRENAGLSSGGWRYDQLGIVGNVQLDGAHWHTARQRFLPTGPLAFLPLSDGRCSIVWSVEEAMGRKLMDLDSTAFARRLNEAAAGLPSKVVEVGQRAAFPLALSHSPDYAANGVVLIGDAAHVIHPMAGQGLNLGFADVAGLVDTLSAARQAGRVWYSPRCLRSYARARKADNVGMMALTDALHRLYRWQSPVGDWGRTTGLSLVDQMAPLKAMLARQAVG